MPLGVTWGYLSFLRRHTTTEHTERWKKPEAAIVSFYLVRRPASTFEERLRRSCSSSLLTSGLPKIIYLHWPRFFFCPYPDPSLQIYPPVLAETGSVLGRYPVLTLGFSTTGYLEEQVLTFSQLVSHSSTEPLLLLFSFRVLCFSLTKCTASLTGCTGSRAPKYFSFERPDGQAVLN